MKNLKSILKLFVLALATIWIASCSNSFDVAEGATGGAAQPAGHVKVVLGSSIAKTILPGDWDAGHKSSLQYYLSGTGTLPSTATKTLAATKLDYGKITTSGQEIELSPGVWTLTVNAYQMAADATPDDTCKVLTATTTPPIDLTTAGAAAVFNLKPVASTNATGTVNINGSVNCGPYLKWVVQDVGTYSGSTFTSAASGAYKVATDVSASTATSNSYTFTYEKDVVAANNYYYVVDFYNGDPASGGQSLGRYREALVVDGGNLSSKTIALGDFLNSPANNPTQLFVTTSFDNIGQAANAVVPGTFLANFTWNTENCGNETGYELIIYKEDVSGGSTTYEAAYTIKKGGVTLGTGAGEVKAGSGAAGADPTMGKDEGQIGVYLQTGYTYKASIRAYNRYDEHDTTDIPTRVTKVNGDTGTDMVYGMFTVAYTLGDANALVQEDDTHTNNSAMYVIGYNYKTELQSLMDFVANGSTSTSYPYVTVSTADKTFKKWITTVASQTSDQMDAAEAVTSIAAGNITNFKLTGVWKSVTKVTVAFPSYTALNSAVWITSYQIGTADPENVTSNAGMDINAATGSTIVFKYDDTKVNNVTVMVDNGRDSATATVDTANKTVTFNTSGLDNSEGHWQLMISGEATYIDSFGDTATSPVSQNFNINLN